MAASADDHHTLDRRLADQAGLAFAPVNTMLKLKKTFFAVGVDVVGYRGTPERNRFF